MNNLYFYIAERLDETMHAYLDMLRYSTHPHKKCQLYALTKAMHEDAVILLQIARCYKDQIAKDISAEVLADFVNKRMEEMRTYQEEFFQEYLDQFPIKDQNNKKEKE